LAGVLVEALDLVAAAFVELETGELLEDVELSPVCALVPVSTLPEAASVETGVNTISTLNPLASQRMPSAAGRGEIGLGEKSTFIYPLYDGFGSQW
jgi:hypothetical protein